MQAVPQTSATAPVLTPLQQQILQQLIEGHDQEAIAYIVQRSPANVCKQLQKMKEAFGAFSNAQLVHLAYQRHVLEAPPKQRHGDHAGFAAHQRRGEEPCQACRAGESVYRAERHAARKAAKLHAA